MSTSNRVRTEFGRIDSLDDKERQLLRELFQAGLQATKADQGFLGFEDHEGYIQIFTCEGKYYHLASDKGFTGEVFSSGEAMIYEQGNALEKPEGTVHAEMASPIIVNQQPAGVMLVDRLAPYPFTPDNLADLVSITEDIADLLGKQLPWPFRTWWRNHDEALMEAYRAALVKKVKPILDRHSNIQASTGILSGDDLIDIQAIELGQHDVGDRGRLIERVIQAGTSLLDPMQITRGEVAVPLPRSGPIKGILSLECYSEEPDDEEGATTLSSLQEAVSDAVAEAPYSYFSSTPSRDDPSGPFYHLLHVCESSGGSLAATLEVVRRNARALCDTEVTVLIAREALGEVPDGVDVHLTNRSGIEDRLSGPVLSQGRARSFAIPPGEGSDRGRLRCPIWANGGLIGVLEARSKGRNDDAFNSPVLEVIAGALGRSVEDYRSWGTLARLAKKRSHLATQTEQILAWSAESALKILGTDLVLAWSEADQQKAVRGYWCEEVAIEQPVTRLIDELRRRKWSNRALSLGHYGKAPDDKDPTATRRTLLTGTGISAMAAGVREVGEGQYLGIACCSCFDGRSVRRELSLQTESLLETTLELIGTRLRSLEIGS